MANIDWKNLPFGYLPTNSNVRCYWRNGKWGQLEVSDSEYINLHMAATALHYGQEAFEGTKAFRGKDGKIRLFRFADNAKRMQSSANYIQMQAPSTELFTEAIKKVVSLNQEFVPPNESGASLYIRPLLIGSGAQVGVKPANEDLFLVFVTPVGPYFKEGFKPVDIVIERDTDRAAPLGTGHIKVGGNYAASLPAQDKAHHGGFSTVLYLDSREKKYIDECGPANFFGIKNNTYITPESHSILPSITNLSLMTLAEDLGMKVERRRIPLEELSTFEEVGACGTAAVISPVKKVVDLENNKIYQYCQNNEPGPVSTKLYNNLRAIQYGDTPDKFNWVTVL
ncbi:MAG TPA: branched-chain amino acid aminotransferase [Bacteroidales bacterium]|nr:branched-chain amino acid aminotransferase [Bacteroidales bacterium]